MVAPANPITKLTITEMLVIGNSTDHRASTPNPFASATTISVIVSSQSDSVLWELLVPCCFDDPDITEHPKNSEDC